MEKELDLGLQEAKLQAVDLEKELLVLRLALGKLRATAQKAFAPITAPFLEALQQGAFWATRLVKKIGIVLSALTGLRAGQDGYTKSVTKTVKAIKRELAGFDEINRLGSPKSGVVTSQIKVAPESFTVPEELQRIIDGIRGVLAPLQEIDLFPLRWQFARLTDKVKVLWDIVKSGLGDVWQKLLVPFAGWIVEEFVPSALLLLQRGVELLTAVLPPLAEGFGKVLQALKPVFAFIGESLLVAMDQLGRLFLKLAQTFTEKSGDIALAFDTLKQTIDHIWGVLGPKLETMRMEIAGAFAEVRQILSQGVSMLIDAFGGLSDFLLGVFTADWNKAWQGLKKLFKNAVNGILSLINGMLSGISAGVNAMIRLLNKLKFTLPDWVPGLGGKTFGLNLSTVKTPQIPLLAKGAVLPANKPFLAMVGDQTHGTNIEAPLATIQQAVAEVLGDMVPAMVSGFESTVEMQNRILSAVLGIQIGDEALANAVNRYNRKMELVRGV